MLRPASTSERDVHAHLLRDSRRLPREQARARESWFDALSSERKEETLFELEMLLKGLVCFGNPRNHPGPPARSVPPEHDHHAELRIVRDALERAGALCRVLLGERTQTSTFARSLGGALPEDAARSRLVKEPLSQGTPDESLLALRSAFGDFVELADGLLRAGRVPERAFLALHATITREVGRNAYFDPLVTLEFRPEFDRLRSPEALEALHAISSEAAHRVAALTFLALSRALRYVALVEVCAAEGESVRRAYVLLAVLRSDLRALTRFLSRRAADQIADGAEHELLALDAAHLSAHADALEAQLRGLARLRAVLDTVASTLRVEMRKAFERDVPPPAPDLPVAALAPQLIVVAAQVRAALQHALRVLCAELRPAAPPPELALDAEARRAASERLRREVWMFVQVLRAFDAKASASLESVDRWAGAGSFSFVRDFLQHFRAIGYQLVRLGDYGRLEPFLASLESLRDVDLLDRARMAAATAECRALHTWLEALFAAVSRRAELAGAPFDKRDAAETLRIYLAAG